MHSRGHDPWGGGLPKPALRYAGPPGDTCSVCRREVCREPPPAIRLGREPF